MPKQSKAFDANDSAVELIREKVAKVYSEEPSYLDELTETKSQKSLSKHQKYMQKLSQQGLSLAEIQTKWHEYYLELPEREKLEVWQEFYDSQAEISNNQRTKSSAPKELVVNGNKLHDDKSHSVTKQHLPHRRKLTAKHHLQSIFFGLGVGIVVVFVFLFGFFNEVFIAPFIEPSRAEASTPIILSTDSIAPTSSPEVIIPKINVQIPVVYSETSTNEAVIENDLQDGVVHYPSTVFPGQNGNAAYFGHSSNNIFNPGKYKFAFVLLHTLVPGDTFYLTYNSKVYVYKVITKNIVDPSDVGVLASVANQTATATLITCDPPGTSLHRLVVVGQQISPDPSTNTTGNVASVSNSTHLPGNGPTFLHRFLGSAIGKILAIIVILAGGYFILYKLQVAWS